MNKARLTALCHKISKKYGLTFNSVSCHNSFRIDVIRGKGRLRHLASHPCAPVGCSALLFVLPFCPQGSAGQCGATPSRRAAGVRKTDAMLGYFYCIKHKWSMNVENEDSVTGTYASYPGSCSIRIPWRPQLSCFNFPMAISLAPFAFAHTLFNHTEHRTLYSGK